MMKHYQWDVWSLFQNLMELGMVTHIFMPALIRQKQVISELENSLVYIAGSCA